MRRHLQQCFFRCRQLILLSLAAITIACSGSGTNSASVHFQTTGNTADLQIGNLQIFIHDVVLLGHDGTLYPLQLNSDGQWQSQQIALLDFPDSAGARSATNTQLSGQVAAMPQDGFNGIRFSVGVPFELNHGWHLDATAPLDRSDLYWAWQSGYKFIQADLFTGGRQWAFHLGSIGCNSPSAIRPPQDECTSANRFNVHLTGFDPLTTPIALDLNAFAQAMHAAEQRPCTGAYDRNPACAPAMEVVGLGASGQAQRLFIAQ